MTTRRLILAAPVCTVLAMLAGCATDPLTAFNQAWNKDAKGTVVPVADAQTIQIRVPKDKGIHPLSPQAGTFAAVRDLVYVDQVVKNGPVSYAAQAGEILRVEVAASNPSSYSRLLYESPQNGSFAVHRRQDNGVSGAGVRYRVQYTIADALDDYTVSLKPVSRETYQQGLKGSPFLTQPPNFTLGEVYQCLTNVALAYTFDVDTPYPTDSITANFMRNPAVQRLQGSYRDPVTGKIISTAYQMPMSGPMEGVMVVFTVNAYPYRNGSKVVINALIPGKPTGAGVVDFGVLTSQVKSAITAIVES